MSIRRQINNKTHAVVKKETEKKANQANKFIADHTVENIS